MDRRTTIQWVMAVSAWGLLGPRVSPAGPVAAWQGASPGQGYGTDPNLLKVYRPGDLWPLTLTPAQRRLAGVLADLIIPADEYSPSATAVGVVDFIDEWVSAPYPHNQRHRPIVLTGFTWLDAEARRRFGKAFADLDAAGHRAICDEICDASRAQAGRGEAARFFALYRDLTAGGFYTTPVGRKDLRYIGNVPRAHFDGPPAELLKKLNLL
jgi:Gluconate 2-dehydrogenase subunit 3